MKEKARKLEAKGQVDKAIRQYARILEELDGKPELADELALFNKLGDLYVKLGNSTAAVEQYEKAINHYAEQGFPNNAIALCNKVLRNAPGRTHIYLKLAKLMMQRGFATEAKQNLLEYAERMQKAGKLEDAFRALKEFADLSPDNEEIRLILAEQLKKAARTDEAQEQLAKLYSELQESGNTSRTRATLERMRAIDPEYDLDAAGATPATRSKSGKNSDIVFLDLDDVVSHVTPADVDEEPAKPIERLEVEATSLAGEGDSLAGAGGDVDLAIDTSIADVSADPEIEALARVEGLDVGESFDDMDDVPMPALDIEATSWENALDVPEIEPVDELPDLEVSLPHDDIEAFGLDEVKELDVDMLGAESVDDLPMLEVPAFVDDDEEEEEDEEDIDIIGMDEAEELDAETFDADSAVDLPMLDVTPSEDMVEDMELEMPWDIEAGGPITDAPEDDDVLGAGEILLEAPEDLDVAAPSISELEFAVADDPDAPEPHRELGEALIEAGDRERGMQELDFALAAYQAIGDTRHAQDVVDEIIHLAPNSVLHHQKRVEFALQNGEDAALVDAYLELADALIRSEELERARFVYQSVLENDPDNFRARLALDTLLPDAVEAEPEVVEVELEAPSEPAIAEPALEASAKPDGGGFIDLGALIMDEEEVAKDTRMRIDHAEPAHQEQQDFAEMLSEFKKGIEANIDADDSQAHYDLGVAFKEMGLLDEAISEFQKALRSSEDRLRTSESLGICFFEKRQYAVAATVLRRAIESEAGGDDTKIGLLYWLGRCEEEQGRNNNALGYYQRIFSIDIKFQDVSDRVNALTDAGS